jgi:NADH dehydrogenase FAD-containing subunit
LSSRRRVVVVGGGFGGARVAQDVAKRSSLAEVTLVDRKDYFDVTYATLRAMVEPETIGKRLTKRYADFLRGDFVRGAVIDIDETEVVLDDGRTVPYDCAVIATGSSYRTFHIPKPPMPMSIEDRQRQFQDEFNRLAAARSVLVIGGGTVGVELAGELADKFPGKSIRLVHGADRLLDTFKPKASRIAERELRNLGVEITFKELLQRADSDDKTYVSKTTGYSYSADIVYMCTGVSIDTDFMKPHFASSLTERGAIQVDEYLRVKGASNLFAVGDCNDVPEGKLGYLADIQGKFTGKNVIRLLEADGEWPNARLKAYKPHRLLSVVTIGRKAGVVQLPVGVFRLRPLVYVKQRDLFIGRALRHLGTAPDKVR